MGLAASQCRLLFLTSRQNDLSAKMQRISMEKMRLASDEDDAYAEYQRLYNRKVYQNSDGTDLSYNEIMGASAANMGYTNYITDASGRVVLSDDLASKFGLSAAEGSPRDFTDKYGRKEDFIRAVESTDAAENIIAKLDEIEELPPGGDPDTLTSDDKTKLNNIKTAYGSYPSEKPPVALSTLAANLGNLQPPLTNQEYNDCNKDDENSAIAFVRDNISTSGIQYLEAICSAASFNSAQTTTAKTLMQSYINQMSNSVTTAGYGDFKKQDTAHNYVRDMTPHYLYSFAYASKDGGHWFGGINHSELKRRIFTKFCQIYCGMSPKDNGTDAGTGNVYSNMCADFNTRMVNLTVNEKGYSESAYKDAIKGQFPNVSESDAKWEELCKYLGKAGATPEQPKPPTDQNTIYENKAKYYKNMYEKLSTLGWVTQSAETIQANLNQGLYYINNEKISNSDNYKEVSDKEAQEQAKTWYDNELRKIKRKEDQWDTQLNRTQTEYTSITNDYNSVKSIIDANIQKSFTYCSNG